MAELGEAMKKAGQEVSEDELKGVILAVDRSGMYYPRVLGVRVSFVLVHKQMNGIIFVPSSLNKYFGTALGSS